MRLIDADALFPYSAVPFENDGFSTADKLYGIIKNATTIDAVPVCRCKDCKHRGDYGCPMYHEEFVEWDDDGYHECEMVEYDNSVDDGFCFCGERKDGDTDG